MTLSMRRVRSTFKGLPRVLNLKDHCDVYPIEREWGGLNVLQGPIAIIHFDN